MPKKTLSDLTQHVTNPGRCVTASSGPWRLSFPLGTLPFVRDVYYKAAICGGKIDSLRIFLTIDVNWRKRFRMMSQFAANTISGTDLSERSTRYIHRAKQEHKGYGRQRYARLRHGIPELIFRSMTYFEMFEDMGKFRVVRELVYE